MRKPPFRSKRLTLSEKIEAVETDIQRFSLLKVSAQNHLAKIDRQLQQQGLRVNPEPVLELPNYGKGVTMNDVRHKLGLFSESDVQKLTPEKIRVLLVQLNVGNYDSNADFRRYWDEQDSAWKAKFGDRNGNIRIKSGMASKDKLIERVVAYLDLDLDE